MENVIKSNPNDKVAIICELNDNRNNTYVIVPVEIALGKINNKGFFQSENGQLVLPNLEDFESQPSQQYYGFLVTLEELRNKYPNIQETTMLMVRYFQDVATNLNILLKDRYNTQIFSTSYDRISKNIAGETVKRIEVGEPATEQKLPAIIIEPEVRADLRQIDSFDLEQYLKARIFENDDILEDIATTIAMNYRARNKKDVEALLSIGPTGSGKTATYNAISEYLNVPLTIYDCNLLTSAGYVGKDLDDVFREVFLNSKRDIEQAERSILVFDEIDKIACRGMEVKDLAVQYQLLKLIDGYQYTFSLEKNGRPYTIDTSFMTIGGLGAFSDIYLKKAKALNIGFGHSCDEDNIVITEEDLINFGLIPEIVGRFPSLHQYKKLTADDLKRILLTSKSSPLLRKKERYQEEFDFELLWEDEAIDAIIEEAIKKQAGGRSLDKLIARTFKKIDRELLRIERERILVPSKKLVLTAKTVQDYHNFNM